VRDIEDGNGVTFQIWKEGQEPASGSANLVIQSRVSGGRAAAAYKYERIGKEEAASDKDPKLFFTAHCAWCPPRKSGNTLTVKLKRPELTKAEWKDGEGKSASKGVVGEALKLEASCNADVEEGAGVMFRVYGEGADPAQDAPIAEMSAVNKGGKAVAEWMAIDIREAEDTSELKYFFIAASQRAKPVKSGLITVKNPQIIEMKWEPETVYYGDEVKLIIKTFETAAFSPQVSIQIWEQKEMKPESFIIEQAATIDKDEIEVSVKIEYTHDDMYDKKSSYKLQAEIICETLSIKQRESAWLQVETGELYE
jgi:hypothetical protein